MMINKSDRDNIRKRLDEIDKERPNNRPRRRLLEKLTKIFNDLQFKRKRINSAFDSSSFYGLKDLEYTFRDLDDYYKPILSKENFDANYQMYSCRGDKDRYMYITGYLDKIKTFLMALIDEKKKSSSQKIQLVTSINIIHLTRSDRITFYVKSKNMVSHLSDKAEDILYQLYDSLLKYFNDKLMIFRTDSGYVFESIERPDIHFHKIDLRRGSSYIPSPEWLDVKKAVINPKNKKDNYCFAYAVTIAIYHEKIGENLDRISNNLIKYTEKFDWNGIDFPASAPDYKRFEKLNEDIALNVMYVPFNEEDEDNDKETIDVLQEYISDFNFISSIIKDIRSQKMAFSSFKK